MDTVLCSEQNDHVDYVQSTPTPGANLKSFLCLAVIIQGLRELKSTCKQLKLVHGFVLSGPLY